MLWYLISVWCTWKLCAGSSNLIPKVLSLPPSWKDLGGSWSRNYAKNAAGMVGARLNLVTSAIKFYRLEGRECFMQLVLTKIFTHEPLPRFQNIKTLTLFKIILTQTLTPALNWVTAVVVRRKAFVVGFFSRILYGKNNFYIRWENVPWSLPKFELPSAFLTETVGMLKNHKSHKIIIQSKNLVSFCNKYWSIEVSLKFPECSISAYI